MILLCHRLRSLPLLTAHIGCPGSSNTGNNVLCVEYFKYITQNSMITIIIIKKKKAFKHFNSCTQEYFGGEEGGAQRLL